ncbi:MAG: hypothetical protein LC808_28010 [Actinobacteria bacterium]|nr:hypothetical protein [Actinomycetota bacterium]
MGDYWGGAHKPPWMYLRDLAVFSIGGLIYLLLLAVALWLVARKSPWAWTVWSSAALSLLVGAMAVFWSAAPELVNDSEGGTAAESEAEVSWARIVFVAIYAIVATSAGLLAFRRAGRQAATATAAVVVGFMVLSLPLVEFFNACAVGRSLVGLNASC